MFATGSFGGFRHDFNALLIGTSTGLKGSNQTGLASKRIAWKEFFVGRFFLIILIRYIHRFDFEVSGCHVAYTIFISVDFQCKLVLIIVPTLRILYMDGKKTNPVGQHFIGHRGIVPFYGNIGRGSSRRHVRTKSDRLDTC